MPQHHLRTHYAHTKTHVVMCTCGGGRCCVKVVSVSQAKACLVLSCLVLSCLVLSCRPKLVWVNPPVLLKQTHTHTPNRIRCKAVAAGLLTVSSRVHTPSDCCAQLPLSISSLHSTNRQALHNIYIYIYIIYTYCVIHNIRYVY